MQKPILFSVAALFSGLVVLGSPALSSPVVGLNPSDSEIANIALSLPLAEKQKPIEVAWPNFGWGSYSYCGWFTGGAAPGIRRDSRGRVIHPRDFPTSDSSYDCINVN